MSLLRIHIIFSLIIFSFKFVCAQELVKNGYNKFYYENGIVSSEGFMRDGKPDGYWKTFNKNGTIKSEGNRKEFQLDSIWKFYNESGKLLSAFNYSLGKKEGSKISYNPEKNEILMIENFEKDFKQGYTLYFSGKDTVNKKIPFDKGKESGRGYEFEKDGRIINIMEFKAGFLTKQEKINRLDTRSIKQGMWKEFYPSGQIKNEVKYVDGKMHGIYKEYNENGSLTILKKYDIGIEIIDAQELVKLDVETEFFDNGKPKIIRTTKNGFKEGVERYYSDSGNISNAKIYKLGILIAEGIYDEGGFQQGIWKEYYPDAKLRSQGEYKNGKKIGEWIYYHQNGEIEQRGKYSKDNKLIGNWKWYYDNKQLHREETYINGKEEGDYFEYDNLGKLTTKGQYADGFEDGAWIYEYGDHREEGVYKNGNREGDWKGYYLTTSKLAYSENYTDGNENGRFLYYFDSGILRIEGQYIMAKKEGLWKYYNDLGLLQLTENYENDELIKIDGTKIKKDELKIEKAIEP